MAAIGDMTQEGQMRQFALNVQFVTDELAQATNAQTGFQAQITALKALFLAYINSQFTGTDLTAVKARFASVLP